MAKENNPKNDINQIAKSIVDTAMEAKLTKRVMKIEYIAKLPG